MIINIDSISNIVGSIIALTFSFFFFISYLIVNRERFNRTVSIFMFSYFILLVAYSIYSSGHDPDFVLLWTKVFYASGVVLIFTVFLLSSEIINRDSFLLKTGILILVAFLLIMIFLQTELFFTGKLNPVKTHSSVIKGPFFPYLLAIIFIADFLLLIRMFYRLFQMRDQLYLTYPILIGLLFWFLEAVFVGIFGSILSLINIRFTLGSIVISFSLSIYSGRRSELKHHELIRIKEENRQIHNSLIYDALSTLYSRQYFTEALEQRVAFNSRQKVFDSLMFIDVDNFKSVNDQLGHHYGDNLISYVGEILRHYSRKSDICARYGGDEFLILLENCNSDDAYSIAENIGVEFKKGLTDVLNHWKGCSHISLSIGIVSSHYWTNNTSEIIKKADLAMYKSKQQGRDSVVLYTESMEEESTNR